MPLVHLTNDHLEADGTPMCLQVLAADEQTALAAMRRISEPQIAWRVASPAATGTHREGERPAPHPFVVPDDL